MSRLLPERAGAKRGRGANSAFTNASYGPRTRTLALAVAVLAALAVPVATESARRPALLTFAVDAGRPGVRGGFCFVRVGSGEPFRLTGRAPSSAFRAGSRDPAWSPRGGRIAYVADGVAGAPDVFVANADGTQSRPLTRTAENEANPAWWPDGRRLAFERDEPGPGGAIVVAGPDGTAERIAIRSDRFCPAEPARRSAAALPEANRPACDAG